jgi:hypothetical protein
MRGLRRPRNYRQFCLFGGRRALAGDRKFVDSPLEESGLELAVPPSFAVGHADPKTLSISELVGENLTLGTRFGGRLTTQAV